MARALGDLDGEVDREAEGIVQLEGGGTIEHGAVCKAVERLVEVDAAGVERAREALLLRIDDTLDKGNVLEELGVGVTHGLVHGIDEPAKEGALDTDKATMEDRATEEATKHVTAPLVAGQDAVGDHEVDGASMVRDDTEAPARAIVIVGDIRDTRDFLAKGDETAHEVPIVERALVLHDGRHALKAHARIEVAMRELRHRAVLLAIVLRKDEVPELKETVAIATGAAIRATAADLLALVEVDLGAGTARAGGACRPEVVVLTEAADVILGDP